MATNLHNVLRNFVWRMETITPQDTATETKLFSFIDPYRDNMAVMGAARLFTVNYLEGEPDDEIHATNDMRRGDHVVEVVVWYPLGVDGFEWLDAQAMVLADRHVIIKQLRDDSKWIGYDADNTSTDVGLHNRWPAGEELTVEDVGTDNSALVLHSKWDINVLEVENA